MDGDMLAYAACAGAQEEIEWEPYLWSIICDHGVAQGSFEIALYRLQEAAEADRIVLALSSQSNFRKALYAPYKAKRGKKPVGYQAFREWLHEARPLGCDVWEREGLEGDDVLGILMTAPSQYSGYTKVLWSGDKDLKQIPGLHLKDREVIEVSQADADMIHPLQTLTGDTTDNYPGCPGMGPVKAAKLLAANQDNPWPAIEAAYVKAGLTREDMLVQARVAKILQVSDYDFSKRQPKLWEPPAQ